MFRKETHKGRGQSGECLGPGCQGARPRAGGPRAHRRVPESSGGDGTVPMLVLTLEKLQNFMKITTDCACQAGKTYDMQMIPQKIV